MVKEDHQMVATNPSASISFTHASAEEGNDRDWRHILAPKVKMENLHLVEAMDQDALSEP
jgi:hypothetical protein